MLTWTRRVLAARHRHVIPLLPAVTHAGTARVIGPAAVAVVWHVGDDATLVLQANLKATPQSGFDGGDGRLIWVEGGADGEVLAPWSVRWTIADHGAGPS